MQTNNSSHTQETYAWLSSCVDICASQLMHQSMCLTHWWPMWLYLTINTMACHYAATADASTPVQVQYIKGPQMDWAINDGLYHQFKTWKIQCDFILRAELEVLLEACKGKMLLCWSGDKVLELYQSWGIDNDDIICRQSGTNLGNIVSPKLMRFMHSMTC